MTMMSMTCYYDTNDELFIIMMMHDVKLLYEDEELLYISVGEMNMDQIQVEATCGEGGLGSSGGNMWCMSKIYY